METASPNAQTPVDSVTRPELAKFKDAFAYWDTQGDNARTVADLGQVFHTVGLNVDSDVLRGFQKDLDVGGESQGTIEFARLLDTIGKNIHVGFTDTEQELLDSFLLLDSKKTGIVDVNDLRPLLITLGGRTNEEVDEMLTIADEQKNGKIKYYTFVKSMFLK